MNTYKEFLSRVLEATRRGRITWTKSPDGEYIGSGAIQVVVRQVVPVVAGPTETLGPQAFEVLAANVVFTAWNGTGCCDLIRSTLAEGLPEWAEQRDLIAERLKAAMVLLD